MGFLNRFGTHFVQRVKMGSKYGYLYEFSREGAANVKEFGFDFNAAASYASEGLTFSGGASLKLGDNVTSSFMNQSMGYSIYTLGSRPPLENDVTEWA